MDTIRTDTLLDGPMTHLVPAPAVCLGCFLNPRGAVGEAPIWIREPTKNMYHFHQLDEIKALCYTSQDYTHTESWNTSFCPAFSPYAPCFLWGKGNRFHRDVTSDLDPYAYRGSVTCPLCVWVWGLWTYRCLRNKGEGWVPSNMVPSPPGSSSAAVRQCLTRREQSSASETIPAGRCRETYFIPWFTSGHTRSRRNKSQRCFLQIADLAGGSRPSWDGRGF